MTSYQSKSVAFGAPHQIGEVKASGDAWEVSGYVSTYDLDLGNDKIQRGAFTKSLKSGHRVRFLYAHDHRQVLGTAEELREDEKGLFGRFKISRTALGSDVHTLLKDGALDSFSIGYMPEDFEIDKKSGIRHLKEISIVECSLVALPMNPAALVTGVKAADYGAMPLDDVLAALTEHRTAALAAVKALCERRRAEGRKLSDRAVELMEALRAASLQDADALLAYLTAPAGAAVKAEAEPTEPSPTQPPEGDAPAEAAAPADVPATAKAAGLVEAHLRRARIAALARKYADVVLPEYDPVAHLERLEPRDPLEGYR